MRIYSILEDRPELWQGEDVNRDAVASIAHAYVWELFKMCEGMQHRIFWHDFNRLVDIAVYMRKTRPDAWSDITAKQLEAMAKTVETLARDIVRYLKEYGVCFDKGEVTQLYDSREEAAKFLDVSEWPTIGAEEDSKAVRNVDARFNKFSDETAKAMYNALYSNGIIECEESAFVWYFGRMSATAQPQRIKIAKGILKKEFALLCDCLNIKAKGFTTYEQINISSAIEEGKRQNELKYKAAAMTTEKDTTPVVRTTGRPNETKATPWEIFAQIFEADFKFHGKNGKCDLQQNLKNYQKKEDTDKGRLIKQSIFGNG